MKNKYFFQNKLYKNFLFYKIKPGGYFHYKIYNKDIYVKNMGYLWVIWDYMVTKIEKEQDAFEDYYSISFAFKNGIPTKGNCDSLAFGLVHPKYFTYSNQIQEIVKFTFPMILDLDEKKSWLKLLSSKLFINEHYKPQNNEIINFGKPYILE